MAGQYMRMPMHWQTDPTLCRDISGEAFRAYCMATLWSGRNNTDGWLDLSQAHELVRGDSRAPEVIWKELLEANLVVSEPRTSRGRDVPGYLLVEFADEQMTTQDWERKKAGERERQRASRARKKAREQETAHKAGAARLTSVPDAPRSASSSASGSAGASWDLPGE